ncbi:hypothetical protein KIL84_011690 [Mauremys mutica]|uniref:Uncharacterized protein n=1 Tax=Mauremys mutica TaxID=74926 RepID=A0A9D4B1A7_9SAUR|nr:hypothetical protein KIL84_011690 [Mauremys mutica]
MCRPYRRQPGLRVPHTVPTGGDQARGCHTLSPIDGHQACRRHMPSLPAVTGPAGATCRPYWRRPGLQAPRAVPTGGDRACGRHVPSLLAATGPAGATRCPYRR